MLYFITYTEVRLFGAQFPTGMGCILLSDASQIYRVVKGNESTDRYD